MSTPSLARADVVTTEPASAARQAHDAAQQAHDAAQSDEVPWKLRVEEPTNRFVYYPIAHVLVRILVHTPVTANQVTLIQPAIAAVAGLLIAASPERYLLLGALMFELRSLLDCVDGSLARAKNTTSPGGHALDGLADWLGVVFLYAGIVVHFWRFPPATGVWSPYLSVGALVTLSLLQGALRSGAHDYFKRKYHSVFATGCDETVEDLREKQQSLKSDSPFFQKAEVGIGWLQHLVFQREVFDNKRSASLSAEQARLFIAQRHSPLTKLIHMLWSVSGGDAFIRITVFSVALGHAIMWQMQLFWASVGVLWIVAVIVFNGWYMRRAVRSALTVG